MNFAALGFTFVLLLGNAFFVVAEYALVRSRRGRLEELKSEGARGSEAALRAMDDMSGVISSCQVGITMTSIGIGAVGEHALSQLLEGPIGKIAAHSVATVIAVAIGYLLITSAHIVVGELVPKLYAIGHAEGVLRTVARPLHWFEVFVRPLSWVLTRISYWVLRLLGQDPTKLSGGLQTSGEIKMLITESSEGGALDIGEAGMLAGVFHLHEQEARQVMTPIPSVTTVDISASVGDALKLCVSAGHTRLLVVEDDDVDQVRGVVHATKLSERLMSDGADAPLAGLEHEAPVFPENKPLDDLLADLQRERVTLAVIADEYGRTAGIATVEDIIEEIVGEIDDETDPAGGPVRPLANGDIWVRGEFPVSDLPAHGIELPEESDDYTSLGGLVFSELGRRPHRGDTVTVNGFVLRVEAMKDNRIEAVRVRPPLLTTKSKDSKAASEE
ncbi:MAG: hemolysin family protein [Actinomycetes bacterium]